MANARITRATTEAFDKTKSTFKSYYNRMERFYRVNGITEEEESKKAALLYCIGQTAFSELEDILLPAKPTDKSLAEIVACLEKYYDPARMELAGAFHFLKRDQKPGESVQDYITALKQKLRDCNYKECCQGRILRDKLVTGLYNSKIRQHFMTMKDISELSFVEACEIAYRWKRDCTSRIKWRKTLQVKDDQ
ncbi:uncharacterized protein [Ptychodera flava]|uniref:uncharacterized protein n=1 Tax=Ptychodera flava TaxID=63121 RepID=UPI00396A6EF2